MSERTVFRTCNLCEATCGVAIDLEGDRVTAVRGDPEDPFSRGYICPKGAAIKALHHDPDRLRAPQLREGSTWREVSWDEAFERVAAGLGPIRKAHGANAVGAYIGNPSVHNLAGPVYGRALLKALGTRNIYSASTVDQMARHVASGLVFGHPLLVPVPDVDRCQHLIILGGNPLVSHGSLWTAPDLPGRLKALKARGGRLVVVDPRRTKTAELADEHVPIRPGTDALLLLAMARVLVEEGLGQPRSEAITNGLDEALRAIADFTPEAVAAATRVPAETTRRMARELAAAPAAAVYGRIGTQAAEFGTLAAWAVDLLNLLSGNLDRVGGAMFTRPAHMPLAEAPGGRGFVTGRWSSRVRGLPEVMGELPVATLSEEIETPGEGQIRALLTVAGNPVLSTPNGPRLERALASLDFMVSVDCYRNETTRFADLILPPPSVLARPHYDLAFYGFAVRNVAKYSPPALPATGPDESIILSKLTLIAQGLGADADPAWVDAMVLQRVGKPAEAVKGALGVLQVVDTMLRAGPYALSLEALEQQPHGVDLGPLQPELPNVLRTRSGRIEIAPEAILADLSRLRGALASPPPDELRLIGRRHLRSNNSWMHNIERLARGARRCTLQINPDDAERLGLSDGAMARVRSRVGELEAEVEVTDAVMVGVLSLPHGWGHGQAGAQLEVAARYPGVNSNRLTDEAAMDPLCGTAVLNGIPVEVRPI